MTTKSASLIGSSVDLLFSYFEALKRDVSNSYRHVNWQRPFNHLNHEARVRRVAMLNTLNSLVRTAEKLMNMGRSDLVQFSKFQKQCIKNYCSNKSVGPACPSWIVAC